MRTGNYWGNVGEGDNMAEPDVDGRKILKWILEKGNRGHGLDRSGLGQGKVTGSCECGNEPLGSIKCG